MMGGQNQGGMNILDSVEIFDVALSSWSAGPKLPTPLRFHRAASVSGRLFVLGGEDSTKVYASVHELVSGAWVARKPMTKARTRFALAVQGGKIYVFGGSPAIGATRRGMVDCEVYDPVLDGWKSIAAMPSFRFDHEAGFVGGRAYVMGGHFSIQRTALGTSSYDPVANTWVAHPSPTSDQILEHSTGTSFVDAGGELILLGGRGGSAFEIDGRSVERLDLSGTQPRWVAATPLRHPMAGLSATLVGTGVFLAGGEIGSTARESGAIHRSTPVKLARFVERKSVTLPTSVYIAHPTGTTGKMPLLVYAHGLSENPSLHTQLVDQLAALGFFVAVPDMRVLNTPAEFAAVMLKVEQGIRTSTKYQGMLRGLPVFGGFSCGGGATVIAAARTPTKAGFALAPWTGCIPSTVRCSSSVVIAEAPKVHAPMLMLANQGDRLGTVTNLDWIHSKLSASRRFLSRLILLGSEHGGSTTGQGFSNVQTTTTLAGRLLQERTYRYVLSFLESCVLDSPADNLSVNLAATADSFDVQVGSGITADPSLKTVDVAVRSPDLYIVTDEAPFAGSDMTLGLIGRANSLYVLLISAPPVGKLPIPPFGDFLLDLPSLLVTTTAISLSQVLRVQVPIPASLKGVTLHLQGFGLDSARSLGMGLSGWRRSVRF